jgi:hypothetical protein
MKQNARLRHMADLTAPGDQVDFGQRQKSSDISSKAPGSRSLAARVATL